MNELRPRILIELARHFDRTPALGPSVRELTYLLAVDGIRAEERPIRAELRKLNDLDLIDNYVADGCLHWRLTPILGRAAALSAIDKALQHPRDRRTFEVRRALPRDHVDASYAHVLEISGPEGSGIQRLGMNQGELIDLWTKIGIYFNLAGMAET